MFFFLIMNSVMLSVMFMFMSHPMSMGLTLLLQTTVITLISGFYAYSFWLSYILFLIMVGGVLILFTYMTSISSNEQFSSTKMLMPTITMMILIPMLTMLIIDKMNIYQMMKNNDTTSMTSLMTLISENNMMINKIYNKPNNLVSLMLMNYLLLTLIIVTKITNMNYGPLRQKF